MSLDTTFILLGLAPVFALGVLIGWISMHRYHTRPRRLPLPGERQRRAGR